MIGNTRIFKAIIVGNYTVPKETSSKKECKASYPTNPHKYCFRIYCMAITKQTQSSALGTLLRIDVPIHGCSRFQGKELDDV
jgi:hypothetical protein